MYRCMEVVFGNGKVEMAKLFKKKQKNTQNV